MKQLTSTIFIAVFLMLASCSFVKTTAEGEQVRVISAPQAASCRKIGKATVSVLDKVAFVERSKEKMGKELEALARNSAASMGGDAIVRISTIKAGEQSFNVYKCRQTPGKY